jgi:hypothetical protein
MEPGLARDALTLLLGFGTGVLSALFGIGGAIVCNPGLRALGAAPLVAVGTTLPSILPGAISGTLRYRREGLIDWHLVTPAAAAGLLAVVAGSLLSHAVPGEGHLLLLLIAVLLAFTAWRTAVGAPPPDVGPRAASRSRRAVSGSRRAWRTVSRGAWQGVWTVGSPQPTVRLRSPSGGPRSRRSGSGARVRRRWVGPTERWRVGLGGRGGCGGGRRGSGWSRGCCRGCWGSAAG